MRRAARPVLAAALGYLVLVVGVLGYLHSDAHAQHDPAHGLQQLDLLYLDEPAPAQTELGVRPGRPALVAFCADACPLPPVTGAQLLRSTDRDLAARYGVDPARGPGYVLLDDHAQVRYRSYDPGLAEHAREIQILLDALPTGAP